MKRLLLPLAVLALSLAPASAQRAAADRDAARLERIAPGGERAARAVEEGVASRYARSLHGRRTASGERYDHDGLTAAHRSLPFGTLLRVVNARNGQAAVVRVNDRGPFIRGRSLDLSGAAARRLGFRGLVRVRYEIVDPEALPSRQPPPPRKVRHV
ncbi:MAG: septal ring lytic transglycosylase RlpA family protein [Rubricoccaceae bacterium]|nr:septal ring lytic transglycosylase RlpA family protein [Rubricoccaceae bacterium]